MKIQYIMVPGGWAEAGRPVAGPGATIHANLWNWGSRVADSPKAAKSLAQWGVIHPEVKELWLILDGKLAWPVETEISSD